MFTKCIIHISHTHLNKRHHITIILFNFQPQNGKTHILIQHGTFHGANNTHYVYIYMLSLCAHIKYTYFRDTHNTFSKFPLRMSFGFSGVVWAQIYVYIYINVLSEKERISRTLYTSTTQTSSTPRKSKTIIDNPQRNALCI